MDYLAAYARKDLDAIDGLFADDVRLRDWKLFVQGRHAALAETAKNFESARSIEIDVLSTHERSARSPGRNCIRSTARSSSSSLDVVEFDDSARISAIRAYLGPPERVAGGPPALWCYSARVGSGVQILDARLKLKRDPPDRSLAAASPGAPTGPGTLSGGPSTRMDPTELCIDLLEEDTPNSI
ncbi:MAG: hypothetical protein IPP50_13970 [Piscinibacter sp.]|nr:hypothetical protein [Piscinibacter sp.]